jgi:hypothetical protein
LPEEDVTVRSAPAFMGTSWTTVDSVSTEVP